MTHVLGDARFHARAPAQTLAAVAGAARGAVPDIERLFTGVAPLQVAGAQDVSFLTDRRHVAALTATGAGAVLVPAAFAAHVPATAVPIVVDAPQEGWARVARLFHPEPPAYPGVHPTASVAAGATVDPGAEIAQFATVEDGASVGAGTRIGPYALIGSGVVVGSGCRIGAHCTISHALLGDRVTLSPGVRIGQEGFSFAHTTAGYLTIPQLGRVIVEDDVEIGANTTIDRGSVTDTVIGAGTRIDNLVQVGHNVRLGKCCVIVAQVGISGSTVLGDFVQVGGQAGFASHLTIGRGVQIGAQSGVIGDLEPGVIVVGSPAMPRQEVFRQIATLKRLSRRPPRDGG